MREDGIIERYGRGGRWFHAGIYLTVLALLATGWWFVVDGYRHDSPLARLTGLPDGSIHEYLGYALLGVVMVWVVAGRRGVVSFVRETLRYRRGDGRWLVAFPRAAFTGRFPRTTAISTPGSASRTSSW